LSKPSSASQLLMSCNATPSADGQNRNCASIAGPSKQSTSAASRESSGLALSEEN
jgi:hypothetical protein